MAITLIDVAPDAMFDMMDAIVEYADKTEPKIRDVVRPEDTLPKREVKGEYIPAKEEAPDKPPEIVVNVINSDDSGDADFEQAPVIIDMDSVSAGLKAIEAETEENGEQLDQIANYLRLTYEADEAQRRKDALKQENRLLPAIIPSDSYANNQSGSQGNGLLDLLGMGLPDFDRRGRRGRDGRNLPVPTDGRRLPIPSGPNTPNTPDRPGAKPRGRFGRAFDFLNRNKGAAALAVAGTATAGLIADSALTKYGMGGIPGVVPNLWNKMTGDSPTQETVDNEMAAIARERGEAESIENEDERTRKMLALESRERKANAAQQQVKENKQEEAEEASSPGSTLQTVAGVGAVGATGALILSKAIPSIGTAISSIATTVSDKTTELKDRFMSKTVETDSTYTSTKVDAEDAVDSTKERTVAPDRPADSATPKAVTPDVDAATPKKGMLSKVGSIVPDWAKGTGAIGTAISGAMLFADINAQRSQTYETEDEKNRDTSKLVGGFAGESAGVLAGGWAGAQAGAGLGAIIGSVVPVVGTAVGAAVGGTLGGIAGSIGGYFAAEELGLMDLGEKAAEKIYDVGSSVVDSSKTMLESIGSVIPSFDMITDIFKSTDEEQEARTKSAEKIADNQIESTEKIAELVKQSEIEADSGWSMAKMFGGGDDAPARPAQAAPKVPSGAKPRNYVEAAETPRQNFVMESTEYDSSYELDDSASNQITAQRDIAVIPDPEADREVQSNLARAITENTANKQPAKTAKAEVTARPRAAPAENQAGRSQVSKPTLASVPAVIDDATLTLINIGHL